MNKARFGINVRPEESVLFQELVARYQQKGLESAKDARLTAASGSRFGQGSEVRANSKEGKRGVRSRQGPERCDGIRGLSSQNQIRLL
jgi:hypothetical protein